MGFFWNNGKRYETKQIKISASRKHEGSLLIISIYNARPNLPSYVWRTFYSLQV